MNELGLVETETLATELFNRFDEIIIMGCQRKTATSTDTFYHRYKGGNHSCLGLCDLLKDTIKEDFRKDDKI